MGERIPVALRRKVARRASNRPLSPEGRVTVNILRLNDADRLAERQLLMSTGLF